MKILVNYATRSRPDKFIRSIELLKSTSSEFENLDILVKYDADDATMEDIEQRVTYPNIRWAKGLSKNKIDAINRDITGDWDILVNMSDDMIPVRKGWDGILRRLYEKEGLGHAAHYPDGTDVRDRLITMSIMGRKLYDFLGYVYHPSYVSLWGDNEFMEVAKRLGVYKYHGGHDHKNILFKHKHPAWVVGVEMDAQYQHTESFYKVDENNFHERKKNYFGLDGEAIRKFKNSI